MGFLDKVKEGASKLKEQNKGFGAAMKRLNNGTVYGYVNKSVKGGDFPPAYIGIEDGKGLIFGNGIEDYVFVGSDVASFEPSGAPELNIAIGGQNVRAQSYLIKFKDGKKAIAEIAVGQLAQFKMTLDL
ncbi:MAG: hypothetical protein ACI3VZ_01325 [Faecousia sp.]